MYLAPVTEEGITQETAGGSVYCKQKAHIWGDNKTFIWQYYVLGSCKTFHIDYLI